MPGRPERGCEVKTLTKPRGAQEMQLIVWMLSAIKASGIDEHQKRRKKEENVRWVKTAALKTQNRMDY